jgi:hypothetical protein
MAARVPGYVRHVHSVSSSRYGLKLTERVALGGALGTLIQPPPPQGTIRPGCPMLRLKKEASTAATCRVCMIKCVDLTAVLPRP